MELVRGEERVDASLALLDGIASTESRLFAMRTRALFNAGRGAREADAQDAHVLASEFLALHVAGTLSVRQSTARQLLEEARHLVVLLPGTWRALDDGWLRVQVARVLVELTVGLDAATCARVEAEVLPWAPDRPAGDVRRKVRRVLARLQDQVEAERSRRRAVAGRSVSSTPLPDGMAGVWAVLPAGAERLFTAALRRLAEKVKTAGDERTVAQREADVLAALPGLVLDGLTGGPAAVQDWLSGHGFRPGGRPADLSAVVLVPLGAALGSSEEPAELVGHGPITAAHARALLSSATIRTATVDPTTGRVLAVSKNAWRPSATAGADGGWSTNRTGETGQADAADAHSDTVAGAGWTGWLRDQSRSDATVGDTEPADEPQYRPSTALRRYLQLRDRRCIGPGCTVPAHRCDVEHRIPWPHGPTCPENTAPISRRCHRAKQAGWRYQRTPDGTTTWTAPGGRTYRVPPDDGPLGR